MYNTIFYSFFMAKCRINLYDICHNLELGPQCAPNFEIQILPLKFWKVSSECPYSYSKLEKPIIWTIN